MKLKKNVAISENGFVFDPSTGDSFSLNAVGTVIINMMREEKNEIDIKSKILEKYDVEEEVFERNFLDFVSMLDHYKLIEAE